MEHGLNIDWELRFTEPRFMPLSGGHFFDRAVDIVGFSGGRVTTRRAFSLLC
jgi:hypothetical protein